MPGIYAIEKYQPRNTVSLNFTKTWKGHHFRMEGLHNKSFFEVLKFMRTFETYHKKCFFVKIFSNKPMLNLKTPK